MTSHPSKKMKKIVFLDRDGTIIYDEGYTFKFDDYKLLEGVKEGLKKLSGAGFEFVVITNQSGIARGVYTMNDYLEFTDLMRRDLVAQNISLLGIFHCPHHSDGLVNEYAQDCECRKPKPGMIHAANELYGPFDYASSWMIGDNITDMGAAKAVDSQLRTILVQKNGEIEIPKYTPKDEILVDYRAMNFTEAVEFILSK